MMSKLPIQGLNEDKKWSNPLGHKGLAIFYPFSSDKVGCHVIMDKNNKSKSRPGS